MLSRLTVIVALAALAGATWADAEEPKNPTYRWTDEQGNITYSDQPQSTQGPTHEAVEGRVDAALVEELFRASGVAQRLPVLAMQVQAEFQRQSGLGVAPEREQVAEIVARHFTGNTLYPRVRAEFLQEATGGRVRNTLAWYRSPLGQHVTALEREAGTPEYQRELRAFVARVGKNWPASRVALMRRLDDATRTTDTTLEALVATLRGYAKAIDAARPAQQRTSGAQLDMRLQQARERASTPLRQVTLMTLLFTYRELSEAELERFARFLESDPGTWYARSLSRAVIRAVGVAGERTGEELVRQLPPERWQATAPRAAEVPR